MQAKQDTDLPDDTTAAAIFGIAFVLAVQALALAGTGKDKKRIQKQIIYQANSMLNTMTDEDARQWLKANLTH